MCKSWMKNVLRPEEPSRDGDRDPLPTAPPRMVGCVAHQPAPRGRRGCSASPPAGLEIQAIWSGHLGALAAAPAEARSEADGPQCARAGPGRADQAIEEGGRLSFPQRLDAR